MKICDTVCVNDDIRPLRVVICHILEVIAGYYNTKMLASHLENADEHQTIKRKEKKPPSGITVIYTPQGGCT